jgi:O-antigen ligase
MERKVNQMVPQSVSRRVSTLILFLAPMTTLAVSPWFNFDPINPIKILVLTCFTATAFGLLVPYLSRVVKLVGKPTMVILLLFVASLLSAFFMSDADMYQQFWGVFGRGTGLLTYLTLVILFFLSNFISSSEFNKKVVYSLIATTTVMAFYCLIQILKLDPIGWSAFFPFGTLGNVNFLSGYMGVALVSVLIFSLDKDLRLSRRIALLGLFALGMFALYKSDSTQGVVALVVGVSSFLLIRSWWVSRRIFLLSLSTYTAGLMALVAGLFDRGPFREFIYQFTVLFRADYMHAAVEMLIRNPLQGVGIDAYDDWYRSERGTISALRTSLTRTSNSAHNIALDLGAGGGFPLLLSYLALTALVVVAISVGLKQGLGRDTFFMAISMSWVAYQVQASVSINQIGVGVWGWLLGGLIVGTVRSRVPSGIENQLRKVQVPPKKRVPNTPPPHAVISSVVVLAIGFLAAYPPLKTDSDYLTATKNGSAEKVLEIAQRPTANAFILSRSAQAALSAGLNDPAKRLVSRLTERFPRNLYGQLVQYETFSTSDEERKRIMGEIAKIDPFVAICYEPNATSRIKSIIEGLTSGQSYDLARGWGLLSGGSSRVNFAWNIVSQEALNAKLASLCVG